MTNDATTTPEEHVIKRKRALINKYPIIATLTFEDGHFFQFDLKVSASSPAALHIGEARLKKELGDFLKAFPNPNQAATDDG